MHCHKLKLFIGISVVKWPPCCGGFSNNSHRQFVKAWSAIGWNGAFMFIWQSFGFLSSTAFFQIKRCQIVAMVAPCHYGINNIQTPTTVPTPHGQYDEFVILTTGNKIFNFSRICVGL
jgi:hypothetical protein